jgi:hypothetical protein
VASSLFDVQFVVPFFHPALTREAPVQHQVPKPDQVVCCARCEHSFDAMDNRAWVSTKESEASPLCPLCNTIVLRSSPEWAIWNSCNGIFEVMPRRAAAVLAAQERYANFDVSIVAARAFVEHDDDQWLRKMREDDLEARRA